MDPYATMAILMFHALLHIDYKQNVISLNHNIRETTK
jgi:hypothetical protein